MAGRHEKLPVQIRNKISTFFDTARQAEPDPQRSVAINQIKDGLISSIGSQQMTAAEAVVAINAAIKDMKAIP